MALFRLALPGIHNVSNALVAIAIAFELEIPVDRNRKGFGGLHGGRAAASFASEAGGIMVVDDYGHDPTEVQANLAAAKQGGIVISRSFSAASIQPDEGLHWRVAHALDDADLLFTTEINPAGESTIPGVSEPPSLKRSSRWAIHR